MVMSMGFKLCDVVIPSFVNRKFQESCYVAVCHNLGVNRYIKFRIKRKKYGLSFIYLLFHYFPSIEIVNYIFDNYQKIVSFFSL